MLRLAYEDSGSACKIARVVALRRYDACESAAESSLARVPEPSKSAQLGEGCLSAE